MRPVNLIPAEERRGAHGPMRTGPLVYVVVGALVLILAGVTSLVLTNNQITDRKSEIAQLEAEDRAAEAKAKQLAAYTQFRELREQRLETISSLADSRFDWERVMRELSLILPAGQAWLTNLTATASPEANVDGGSGGSSLRGAVPGPALELEGCATGQDAVAGFVTALKDVDGVTRVAVQVSELSDQEEGAGSSEDSKEQGGTEGDCRTRSFITSFTIVAAFDAAPVPVSPEAEAAAVSATEQAQTTSSETEEGG
jgi:Tfp pilus assembly protein PilN